MTWSIHSSTPLDRQTIDLQSFVTQINQFADHPLPAVRSLFDPQSSITIGRAPGRLDLMGGIADYSGSLVLQLPIEEATFAAIQKRADRSLTIVSLEEESLGSERNREEQLFQMSLTSLEEDGQPISYAKAQAFFKRQPRTAWAAYIVGAFLVLMREENATFAQGANLLIQSSVPEAKGVSSSAAVEVATMQAIAQCYGLTIPPRRMGILCQMVENLIVGAPCGVMDQMTACCGEANQLLALLCQPAEIQAPVQIPNRLAVWGIDSGIRHAVSGADYGSVRIGAFMGYRILLDAAGIADKSVAASAVQDQRWGGYLANITPSEYEQEFRQVLPKTMKGAEFSQHYGETTDSVTQVDPEQTYAVRQPTIHPIYEHFRIKTFARLLTGDPVMNGPLLGEYMYQSHASYSACGLGSDGTDEIVAIARSMGSERGIYGAKITGGGSGGTVAILGRADAAESIQEIAKQYAEKTDRQPYIFSGSSAGANAFVLESNIVS